MKRTVLMLQAVIMLIGFGKAGEQIPEFSEEDALQHSEIDYYMSLMEKSASNLMSREDKLSYFKHSMSKNEKQVSKKYLSPPKLLQKEYQKDGIADPWEPNAVDYQPIIGILTQPIRDADGKDTEQSYVLESNDNYQKWSGSRTIAIPYNIDERALIDLLGNINGVHLTGGGLVLIDDDGKQHPYYVTAKRIINFSKMVKEKYDVEFPVLGICQGLEVISVVQGNDNIDTLDHIKFIGPRKIDWVENQKSRFFNEFPQGIRHQMEEHRSGLHLHEFSVSFDTYKKTPGLGQEMIIIQQDNIDGVQFIDAMEHKKYPIFAMMYHPEYMVVEDFKWGSLKKTEAFVQMTDEIAFRTSLAMNRWARKNDFRWTLGEENLIRLSVNRVPVKKSGFFSQYIYQKLD